MRGMNPEAVGLGWWFACFWRDRSIAPSRLSPSDIAAASLDPKHLKPQCHYGYTPLHNFEPDLKKENMSTQAHEVRDADFDATALISDSKRVVVIAAAVTVAIVGVLIALAVVIAPAEKPKSDMSEMGVASRIAKVGSVSLKLDSAAQGPRSGEDAYAAQCSSCHASGALGAPKFADAAAWAARLPSGLANLAKSALQGKNAMPAQGGGDLSDVEVTRAVVHLANSAGAKFSEPEAK
jgi:cytochrome c5